MAVPIPMPSRRAGVASCAALLMATLALAGCADGDPAKPGTFTLAVLDDLAGGRLDVRGAYLHKAGAAAGASDAWVAALGNASLAFAATGANVSAAGDVPAGDYDGVRLLFGGLTVGMRTATLARSGIELALNVTVPTGGDTELRLTVAWADALFESSAGLAFEPVLLRLVLLVDGAEAERLEASAIRTGDAPAPVARMRIFDATGLEAFASTFVAESPEDPVVANAGELVLSATGSEAVAAGTRLASYSWDVDGTELAGATVRHTTPVSGGNVTVRLTVTDSSGGSDAQTVRIAVKPGRAERSFNFTGSASGFLGEGAATHPFGPITSGEVDGAPARLAHVTVLLEPGSSPVPVSDLDVSLLDGAGAEVASASGSGSQHRIEQDITEPPGDGEWSVVVTPQQAVEAAYTVTVTLTWVGLNPGMEAFLASFDDGHGHQH